MLRILIALPLTFLVLFPANGLFHVVLAAPFFDASLQGLGDAIRPMSSSHPGPVGLLDALLTLGMVGYAVLLKASVPKGALIGASLNFLTAMSWNLANMATLSSWPIRVLLVDVPWHTALGAATGMWAAFLLRGRKSQRA